MNPFWKFAALVCPTGKHGLESNPCPGTCRKGANSSVGLSCLLGWLNHDKQVWRYGMLQRGLTCFLFLPLSGVTPCTSTDTGVIRSSHRPAPHSSGWSAWGVETHFQHLGYFLCRSLFRNGCTTHPWTVSLEVDEDIGDRILQLCYLSIQPSLVSRTWFAFWIFPSLITLSEFQHPKMRAFIVYYSSQVYPVHTINLDLVFIVTAKMSDIWVFFRVNLLCIEKRSLT